MDPAQGNVEAMGYTSTKRFATQRNCDASQEADVREVFKSSGYGVWIPLPEFPHLHEFNRAIHNLRWRDDLNIQNKTERSSKVGGRPVTNSFYRLNPGSWRELRGKPEKEPRHPWSFPFSAKCNPPKSWEEVCAERDRKLAESQNPPALVLTP